MPSGRAVLCTSRWSSLVTRALVSSVAAVVLLLAVLSFVSGLDVHRQARIAAAESLAAAQAVIEEVDGLRDQARQAHVARLSDEPLLRNAAALNARALSGDAPLSDDPLIDRAGSPEPHHLLGRLTDLATTLQADAVVLVDRSDRTVAAAGPMSTLWPLGRSGLSSVQAASLGARTGLVRAHNQVYRAQWIDLASDSGMIGRLYATTLLDDRYAHALARVSGVEVVIADDTHVVAATITGPERRVFHARMRAAAQGSGVTKLGGGSFAYRRLRDIGSAHVYALTSVDAVAGPAVASASRMLALMAAGLGGLALAGVFWLTRTIVEPADRMTRTLEERAWSHDLTEPLPRSGNRELDKLVDVLEALMAGRVAAETATQEACTSAIRAVAAALESRDAFTVGHSERVSALAVAIGHTLSLADDQVDVLRLGALLHDIGNIGVPDGVLRKPAPLTDNERDLVKAHPALGANILRSVPFLAPHIPIVELHHERPDGRGYPYGLRSESTPLLARIVRVADAYDAMTNPRAYREALTPERALGELWRGAGIAFDETVVEALAMALPLTARAPFAPISVARARS